jgi:hypothetical protein
VIATCLATGVPIYQGHIDRALYEATLRASAERPRRP